MDGARWKISCTSTKIWQSKKKYVESKNLQKYFT